MITYRGMVCADCNKEFKMFSLWDFVFSKATNVENYSFKWVFGTTNMWHFVCDKSLPGIYCEECVETRIGRPLFWWDYSLAPINFPIECNWPYL